jgi:hypothetical protein
MGETMGDVNSEAVVRCPICDALVMACGLPSIAIQRL